MITSKKLSPERINEIKNFPITYDEDSPKLTPEQIARMKPVNNECSGRRGAGRIGRDMGICFRKDTLQALFER